MLDQPKEENPWALRAQKCTPEELIGFLDPDQLDGPNPGEDVIAMTAVVTERLHQGEIPADIAHQYFQTIGGYSLGRPIQ